MTGNPRTFTVLLRNSVAFGTDVTVYGLQDVTTLQNVKFVMKGGEVYKNDYAQ